MMHQEQGRCNILLTMLTRSRPRLHCNFLALNNIAQLHLRVDAGCETCRNAK